MNKEDYAVSRKMVNTMIGKTCGDDQGFETNEYDVSAGASDRGLWPWMSSLGYYVKNNVRGCIDICVLLCRKVYFHGVILFDVKY